MEAQNRLLEIVKKWNIKLTPEYRGFRCADCQKYIHKAWHWSLNYGGFKTPVHFCHSCQKKFGFKGAKFKSFTCDNCGKNMFKTFHIWEKKGKVFEETHFCKKCFKLNSTKLH